MEHLNIIRIFANYMIKEKKYTEQQELIAKFSNALANPVRVCILQMLAQRNCCYHSKMIESLPIASSTLSQHLNVLKDAGLIIGEVDPPKTKYCINRENWNLAKGLLIGFFD